MGRETGLPISSSELSRRTISRVEEAGFSEHLDGGEGHGDADLHVERAGAPQARLSGAIGGDAEGHGAEGAEGPDGIDVAEDEGGFCAGFAAGAEAGLDDVAVAALAMDADAAAEGARVLDGNKAAGIDSGLRVRGGFGQNELAGESDERVLFATCAGKESAHRNGGGLGDRGDSVQRGFLWNSGDEAILRRAGRSLPAGDGRNWGGACCRI